MKILALMQQCFNNDCFQEVNLLLTLIFFQKDLSKNAGLYQQFQRIYFRCSAIVLELKIMKELNKYSKYDASVCKNTIHYILKSLKDEVMAP